MLSFVSIKYSAGSFHSRFPNYLYIYIILPSPEFQDQEKWVATHLTTQKTAPRAAPWPQGSIWSGPGKNPVELPVSFSVEADSNKWIMSWRQEQTIHVWQWRIHHRSVVVVIVIIKHRTPAVNKSLQARHNHVQGLQQALAKSSLLHYISEFCSLTDWKDKSVISVSRWTDMIWLVRMAMALATQN